MRQAGIGVDTWDFEIISSKHYLVGKYVKNGRHSKVERCRRVTINNFNMQFANHSAHNVYGMKRDLNVSVRDGNNYKRVVE